VLKDDLRSTFIKDDLRSIFLHPKIQKKNYVPFILFVANFTIIDALSITYFFQYLQQISELE
jgi:hypothetical protein